MAAAHQRIFRPFISIGVIMALCGSAQAMGRKPKPQQGYPDYNRLELHPKTSPPIQPETERVAPPPKFFPSNSSITPPVSLPSDVPVDAAPKPPPKAVISKDESEPSMSDDMMNTLIPGATAQK